MAERRALSALKPILLEARILGVFPHLKHDDIRSNLYKIYSILFLICAVIFACFPITNLLQRFVSIQEGQTENATSMFELILMTTMLFLTTIPLIHFVLYQGENLNTVLINFHDICTQLGCEQKFYSKLYHYACIYAIIILPLYYINFIRESITGKILAVDIFEFNGYALEAAFIIRTLQFVVETEMMVLVLALIYLLRFINEEIKVISLY